MTLFLVTMCLSENEFYLVTQMRHSLPPELNLHRLDEVVLIVYTSWTLITHFITNYL